MLKSFLDKQRGFRERFLPEAQFPRITLLKLSDKSKKSYF